MATIYVEEGCTLQWDNATGADVADIEIAYQWYAGMDDIMGEEGLPLEGARLDVYEILQAGDVFDAGS